MKLQLHLIDDKDIIIRIVGVDGHKDFEVGEYNTLRNEIKIDKFDNPTKWSEGLIFKVIKTIFKTKGVDIRNENLKKLYRKGDLNLLKFESNEEVKEMS